MAPSISAPETVLQLKAKSLEERLGSCHAYRKSRRMPVTAASTFRLAVPRFRFVASGTTVATVTLQFTAAVVVDGVTFDDTLQATVDVLGTMPMVTLATSMAVQGERPLVHCCHKFF